MARYGADINSPCDLEYIGNTGRRLGKRNTQHTSDILNCNRLSVTEGETAVVHYFYDTSNVPDFDKAKTVEGETSFSIVAHTD